MGPASAMIIKPTTKQRKSISHHGVFAALVSRSFRPCSNVTAEKRILFGCGGKARKITQSKGNRINAPRISGDENAKLLMHFLDAIDIGTSRAWPQAGGDLVGVNRCPTQQRQPTFRACGADPQDGSDNPV